MGLTAGPLPIRVDATVKAGLLGLIDHAAAAGWSLRRTCRVLEVNEDRVLRWRRRRLAGDGLKDRVPGPTEALHGILGWEREAIVELFDEWVGRH